MQKFTKGKIDRIILPNGKIYFTGHGSVNSVAAKEKGLQVETVNYSGFCTTSNINERMKRGFDIHINGVSCKDFSENVATEKELVAALNAVKD